MTQPASEPEHIRLTYEDYLAIPDDGKRYEIIDGELYVVPAPSADKHQVTLVNLLLILGNHVKARNLGLILPSPVDVVLSDYDVVQPDIVFVSRERLSIVGRAIEGAPDLVVEILSPGTVRLDRTVKRQLYASHGVRYYWIVDPQARQVEEYELAGGAYRLRTRVEGPDVFRPALFLGLEIRMGEVWAWFCSETTPDRSF